MQLNIKISWTSNADYVKAALRFLEYLRFWNRKNGHSRITNPKQWNANKQNSLDKNWWIEEDALLVGYAYVTAHYNVTTPVVYAWKQTLQVNSLRRQITPCSGPGSWCTHNHFSQFLNWEFWKKQAIKFLSKLHVELAFNEWGARYLFLQINNQIF